MVRGRKEKERGREVHTRKEREGQRKKKKIEVGEGRREEATHNIVKACVV